MKNKQLNIALVFLIPFLVFGMIALHLGKDVNWDLKNYHFYNGYAFLTNRLQYDYIPAQIQTFLNPLMDVPIYLIIRYLPDRAGGFIIGGFQGFNVSLLILIGHFYLVENCYIRSKSRWILSLCFIVLTGIFSPMFLSQIGTTFGDNITSVFILFGILILAKFQAQISAPLFFASGAFFGVATGLKLTNAPYCVATSIAIVLLVSGSLREKFRSSFLTLLGIVVGILFAGGYWMWIMFINYRSPLFPFYNQLFKSPYYVDYSFRYKQPPDSFSEGISYLFHWAIKSGVTTTAWPHFRDPRWLVITILLVVTGLSILFKFYRKLSSTSNSLDVRWNIISFLCYLDIKI
jgi:hypothetical protein